MNGLGHALDYKCECKCTTHLLSAPLPSQGSAVSAARHVLGEINVFST